MITYFYLIYEHLREMKGGAPAPEVKSEGKRWPWIVLVIVGLLTFVVVPLVTIVLVGVNPVAQFAKARDANRMQHQQVIQGALDRYYVTNGIYPQSLDELLMTGELSQIPKDPETQSSYDYQMMTGGTDYRLCVEFESEMYQGMGRNCVSSGPGGVMPFGIPGGDDLGDKDIEDFWSDFGPEIVEGDLRGF
jgi:hypothetical protein